MTMIVKKFANFMLRIFDQYVEISNFSQSDITDVDLFEVWDYLEENLKLPIPVLTTHSKCYSASPEAQLQLGDIAKKYYSAIAVVVDDDEKNSDIESDDVNKDFFLQEVQIKMFKSKEEAVAWLEDFGPVEEL
jgi:hypothetical protein